MKSRFTFVIVFALLSLSRACLAESPIGTVARAYPKWDFVVLDLEETSSVGMGDFLVIHRSDGSRYYAIITHIDHRVVVADVHPGSEPAKGDVVTEHYSFHPESSLRFRIVSLQTGHGIGRRTALPFPKSGMGILPMHRGDA